MAGGQVHYHHSHAQRCICSFSLAVAFQDGFILKIAVPFCFEIQSPRTELRLAQIVIVLISDGFLKKIQPMGSLQVALYMASPARPRADRWESV